MAFIAANLALEFIGGPGFAKRYVYYTTDSMATVQASGYFSTPPSAFAPGIGDVIEVRVVDAVNPATRTALTGVQRLVVATNDGTTVTTTQESASGQVVNTTATTLTITRALHADRMVTINSAAPIAITMPQATGTGARYRFFIGTVATATSHTIKVANATDVMAGYAFCVVTTTTVLDSFKTSATSDTISLNGTTLGGVVGDRIEIIDVATGVFSVLMYTAPTGTEATPFSASV